MRWHSDAVIILPLRIKARLSWLAKLVECSEASSFRQLLANNMQTISTRNTIKAKLVTLRNIFNWRTCSVSWQQTSNLKILSHASWGRHKKLAVMLKVTRKFQCRANRAIKTRCSIKGRLLKPTGKHKDSHLSAAKLPSLPHRKRNETDLCC